MKSLKCAEGEILLDDDIYARYKGHTFIVDKNGYVSVSQRSRTYQKRNGNYPKYEYKLHRLILNTPKGKVSDHINGNKLDNRRENLRICSRAQNGYNQSKPQWRNKESSSIYKGVYYMDKSANKKNPWKSTVVKARKVWVIGCFSTELQAAMAYDMWASHLYGKYARLNFPAAIIN